MERLINQASKDNVYQNQIEVLDKIKKENKLVDTQRRVLGHTLFEYNVMTGEINPADINRKVELSFKTLTPIYRQEVQIKPNCIYRQALNKRNVIERLRREGFSL